MCQQRLYLNCCIQLSQLFIENLVFEPIHFFYADTLSERCIPTVLHGLKDCQVIAGASYELECQFFGTPEPKVAWTKDGGPLELNDRINMVHTEGVVKLFFAKVDPDDEGWYKCRLINPCGVVSIECEMIVVEAPKFIKMLEDVTIVEGTEFFFLCFSLSYS